ncbi:MAG: hypothetical protein NZ529_06440 [Cytophagaceae bacterium]|nr:hypothetical protein [Cytophagaceae bacterium]MDW8456417.1 hypothetical protein [Cytophagaceae bacterium]
MKITSALTPLLFSLLLASSCKKNYVCKGTDISGEKTHNCNYCSKKQKEKYIKELQDAGWQNVSCEEK